MKGREIRLRRKMRPFYGYHALPIFALLSVVSVATGVLLAVFLQLAVGLMTAGLGSHLIAAYAISMRSPVRREQSLTYLLTIPGWRAFSRSILEFLSGLL